MTPENVGRVAIVNRGESAMRLIHAATELRQAGTDITTIALCTEAERHAMFARYADEYHVIASDSGIAYLDYAELERALVATRADAAWVGWGFVAEHPEFADLCDRIGVTFVGPSGDVMRSLGDKIGAKHLAEEVGAPVAPWSQGPVTSPEDALRHGEAIGYPLLIKATSGGGGRGIRFVDTPDQLAEAFERASAEALRSFGDATVFMERRLTEARHIEVQIAADSAGTVWALGVRDCSVQRRNQKVLEESASPILTNDQSAMIASAAAEIARAAGYVNVGTVEFLYQPAEQTFAFLEVNTRLQVEHSVTELTTGVDLVKLQLHIATGGLLQGEAPAPFGHAIEARLNAEDPQRDFSPSPGYIEHLDFAHGPGVRIDTGVAAGDTIPPDYDAMVAKVIAWGRTRDEARVRLLRALEQTVVVVRGGTTNKAFLTDLLTRPEFVSGQADTRWLDRLTEAGEHLPNKYLDVALLVAALDAWDAENALERARFYGWAGRGRPQTLAHPGISIECRLQGERYELQAGPTSPTTHRIELDGHTLTVTFDRLSAYEGRLRIGERSHRIISVVDGADHLIEVDGVAHRVSRDSAGLVRAPAPALVVSAAVSAGDVVEKGDLLVVLESMKMETTVVAPVSGVVRAVTAVPNTQVDAGAALVRIDVEETSADDTRAAQRVNLEDLAGLAPPAEGTGEALPLLEAMKWSVLGFDTGESPAALATKYATARATADVTEAVIQAEIDVLSAFADISALSRNQPSQDAESHEAVHSPESYFHRYLRSLDAEAEGLPPSFQTKVLSAVGWLGSSTLDRTPELEAAAHQIFRAQQLAPERTVLTLAILGQPPAHEDELAPTLFRSLRETLDRIIETTQIRHPAVGDQARSLRFRTFDEPAIEATRNRVMAKMAEDLEQIATGAPGTSELRAALTSCPYPLVGLLGGHEPGSSFDGHEALLEILTERNYQIRDIEETTKAHLGGRPVLTLRYRRPHPDELIHAVATLADAIDLQRGVESLADAVSRIDATGRIVADVYVCLGAEHQDADALAEAASTALSDIALPLQVDRIAFSAINLAGVNTGLTYRRHDATWVEDRPVRGIHPMIAVRLGLWRLREHFEIEPLAASRGTHLFRAVAKDNPRDERIVAAAEVRDLASEFDDDGLLSGLPGLEHVYTACIDGLRRTQADRPDNRRLYWNRIFIYVWEPANFGIHEANVVVELLEPLGRGLGLEEVNIQAKLGDGSGTYNEVMVRIAPQPGSQSRLQLSPLPESPLQPLNDYERKVVSSRQRGTVYPYELVPTISGTNGSFVEYDIDPSGHFVAVDRAPGTNQAGIVAGVASTPTERYPEGMRRVVLLGDPTKSLGSLAEAECKLVIAALDLAQAEQLPVEWYALSSGARIAMDSGTENMDWIAAALRRIVDFTQEGGEINVVVTGINVGAQPYWNAEATMLQHTKGILVMTPESAMVLTGKQALDISGGVSAEDNFGIGGHDRVMGPNGQAQYWAPDLAGACDVLFKHYAVAYRAPGERFARRAPTSDPVERNVCDSPHVVEGCDFTTVGDIWSDVANPGRKKPFDIRTLIRAVADQDHPVIERWAAMRDAETSAVMDAMLGGIAVSIIGVESRPVPRHGALPADGPDQWTAGTLFPRSSKKVARGINAASGNRPLVLLANLSGFDGSPESLRELQLEYGAEIGRAIVNFEGPIVFCVVSRYHGGAFVVFSGALNDSMTVLAVEGTYASVLGGAPAAAVVFAAEVRSRVAAHPQVAALTAALKEADTASRSALVEELRQLTESVRSDTLGDVATEFDAVHSIERAQQVGSVHQIIKPSELRPRLVDAVEAGIAKTVKT